MKINNPDSTQIPQLRTLWQEAFGDTEKFLDLFFGTAFDTKRAVCITENEEVLAALYWFDCTCNGEKLAYIYAVATSKKHRFKGLCRQLMDYTHTELISMGYKAAILVPGSKELFDMYEKLSYKICSFIEEFTVAASDKIATLAPITKEEFATLRKKYLPENAVVQENESLDFLGSYAEFYKGDDFIFVCSKDKDKLVVSEILGNEEPAASITRALGCESGFFRTVGNLRPFSMWCDFSGGKLSPPKYFGLAFD